MAAIRLARAGSFCKVTALLPYEGHGSLLYRVRSETEQFERVVAEADLSRKLDALEIARKKLHLLRHTLRYRLALVTVRFRRS